MKAKQTLPRYNVMAKIKLTSGVLVEGESLEGALDKARSMTITDFVKLYGDNFDSEIRITGVFE